MQWENDARKTENTGITFISANTVNEHLHAVLLLPMVINFCPSKHSPKAIATSKKYNLVVSCVAYDERNTELLHCLNTTGISNFAK